jgi:hypothetical protein
MLWGHLVTIVIVNLLLLYFLKARYDVSMRRFFIMMMGPSLSSVAVYSVVICVVTNLQLNAFFELCIGGGIGVAAYWFGLFLCRGVFREDILAVKNSYPKLYQLIHLAKLV